MLPNNQFSVRIIGIAAPLLTCVFELVTVVSRFGFKLESTRDTQALLSWLTCGYRIHHGYVGVVVILVAWALLQRSQRLATVLLTFGVALFCSDLIHHFAVLWPITGSPQFDLVYPPNP